MDDMGAMAGDKEMAAITAIGEQRSKTRMIVFGIAWPALFLILLPALGIFVNIIASLFAAAGIAHGVMLSRTDAITNKVCTELDISPEDLNAEQYLLK